MRDTPNEHYYFFFGSIDQRKNFFLILIKYTHTIYTYITKKMLFFIKQTNKTNFNLTK